MKSRTRSCEPSAHSKEPWASTGLDLEVWGVLLPTSDRPSSSPWLLRAPPRTGWQMIQYSWRISLSSRLHIAENYLIRGENLWNLVSWTICNKERPHLHGERAQHLWLQWPENFSFQPIWLFCLTRRLFHLRHIWLIRKAFKITL